MVYIECKGGFGGVEDGAATGIMLCMEDLPTGVVDQEWFVNAQPRMYGVDGKDGFNTRLGGGSIVVDRCESCEACPSSAGSGRVVEGEVVIACVLVSGGSVGLL